MSLRCRWLPTHDLAVGRLLALSSNLSPVIPKPDGSDFPLLRPILLRGCSFVPTKGSTRSDDKKKETSHLARATPYFKCSTGQLCHMLQNLHNTVLDISPDLPKGNFSFGPRMLFSSTPSSCLQCNLMLLLLLLYFLSLRYYSYNFSPISFWISFCSLLPFSVMRSFKISQLSKDI